MNIGDEFGSHRPGSERVPVEVGEPLMLLELAGTFIVTNSVLWLSLKAFVDEVCGLDGPTFRYFVPLNLDLFAKDLLSDLTSASTDVWPTTLHALVGNDANGEIVCC